MMREMLSTATTRLFHTSKARGLVCLYENRFLSSENPRTIIAERFSSAERFLMENLSVAIYR